MKIEFSRIQCLANQLQLYYGSKDGKREKLLWTFNKVPDLFRHMDLISNFEYDLIKQIGSFVVVFSFIISGLIQFKIIFL